MKHLEDKLEAAVMNYVDSLPLDSLIEWVTNDVWQYYRKSADEEEVKTFIEEMEDMFGSGGSIEKGIEQ